MKAQATVTITPAMLAEAFWSMPDDEQAQFFSELSRVIREDNESGNKGAYSNGELQWFYLGDRLRETGQDAARSMLMTMAAPLYLNTLRASGQY